MNSLYEINYLKGKTPIKKGLFPTKFYFILGESPLEKSIL